MAAHPRKNRRRGVSPLVEPQMIPLLFPLSVIVGGGGVSRFAPPAAHERIGAWARRESPSGDTGVLLEFPKEDLWLDREIAWN